MKEEGKAGREQNEGGEAGREVHGVMDGVKEEEKARRERNEGGAGRGRAWSEGGVKEYRGQGGGDTKDEKQVGEEHCVREGVSEGGMEGREREKLRRRGR